MFKNNTNLNLTFKPIITITATICAAMVISLIGLNIFISKVSASMGHTSSVSVKSLPSSSTSCGSYAIAGSTTLLKVVGTLGQVSFSLWYDTCSSSNFTSANIIAGSINNMSSCVHRNSGLDGGSLDKCNNSCASTGICNSPEIFSPDNTSYAWVNLADIFIRAQTSSF